MSHLYGTQARVYGINGSVTLQGVSSSLTEWPTFTDSNLVCIITGYTFTPSMAGSVEALDQNGRIVSEAFAYANFELQINFEIGSTTLSGGTGITKAKLVQMPLMMAKITLANMDNQDLNGTWNFISGSMTGTNQGWKTGSMTLRAISPAANTSPNAKVAFASIAAS